MTALNADAGSTPRPDVHTEEAVPETAVIRPLAGNPAMLGLPSFIAGSVTAVFALIDLALLLLYIGFAQASPLGVPSSGLLKAAGYVVLVFAAIGVYLFFDSASVATGGKTLPLGKPLLHS
jgi:hypothetical protein